MLGQLRLQCFHGSLTIGCRRNELLSGRQLLGQLRLQCFHGSLTIGSRRNEFFPRNHLPGQLRMQRFHGSLTIGNGRNEFFPRLHLPGQLRLQRFNRSLAVGDGLHQLCPGLHVFRQFGGRRLDRSLALGDLLHQGLPLGAGAVQLRLPLTERSGHARVVALGHGKRFQQLGNLRHQGFYAGRLMTYGREFSRQARGVRLTVCGDVLHAADVIRQHPHEFLVLAKLGLLQVGQVPLERLVVARRGLRTCHALPQALLGHAPRPGQRLGQAQERGQALAPRRRKARRHLAVGIGCQRLQRPPQIADRARQQVLVVGVGRVVVPLVGLNHVCKGLRVDLQAAPTWQRPHPLEQARGRRHQFVIRAHAQRDVARALQRRNRVIQPQQQPLPARNAIADCQRLRHLHRVPHHQQGRQRHFGATGSLHPQAAEQAEPGVLDRPQPLERAVLAQVTRQAVAVAFAYRAGHHIHRGDRHLVPAPAHRGQQALVQFHRERVFPMPVLVAGAAAQQSPADIDSALLQQPCKQ